MSEQALAVEHAAPAPAGRTVPGGRAAYWHICGRVSRALQQVALNLRLARLRRLARRAPRFRSGEVRIDGLHVAYDDALALYMEYKHIFGWGIYDFRPQTPRPRVLDCGAHVGLSGLRFHRIAPESRITLFEPDARVLPLLRSNLERNGVRNAEIVPAGLAAQAGRASFVDDGADGGALAPRGYEPPGAQRVQTVRLSDYLDEPVDFLKMNIEGAELDVLREAANGLPRVRQMVIEYHGFPQPGQVLHELLALLHECGFRYALHHFDYETNPALRPPFRMHAATRFFQLISATRLAESDARGDAPIRRPAASAIQTRAADDVEPVSRQFGFDRGKPIDRHYIEEFLSANAALIRGRVLEVGDSHYTRRFGATRVTQSDVLHLHAAPGATIVADLADCPQIADAGFDCLILTQTLPFIFDLRAALRNAWRIVRPGGALLITVPGISQLSQFDAQRWGDYWRFTPQGLGRLLAENCPGAAPRITVFGNVRSAAALLDGLAAHELPRPHLDGADADYPLIIAAALQRPAPPAPSRAVGAES